MKLTRLTERQKDFIQDVLTYDDTSSNAELIAYFQVELNLDEASSQELVSRRGAFVSGTV
jgi:hypothetical protein